MLEHGHALMSSTVLTLKCSGADPGGGGGHGGQLTPPSARKE